jgi:hypothetical protein
MSADWTVPPPKLRRPRTETERLRRQLSDQRIARAGEPAEIRLPITVAPGHRLIGCPPAGAFVIHSEEQER